MIKGSKKKVNSLTRQPNIFVSPALNNGGKAKTGLKSLDSKLRIPTLLKADQNYLILMLPKTYYKWLT